MHTVLIVNVHIFQASKIVLTQWARYITNELTIYKKHRYIIFRVREDKIDIDTFTNRDLDYSSFLDDIQKGGENECRLVSLLFIFKHLYTTIRKLGHFRVY